MPCSKPPIIGMIVPPAAGEVPPEPLELFPDVNFIATGLALKKVSPDGFDQVLHEISRCAGSLAARGADVISLMGTSLSFYRGPAGNAELIHAMQAETGLPCTTMTNAVLDALRAIGGPRVAIATAYTDAINKPLVRYLEASGFGVECLEALNITSVEDVLRVTDAELTELCLKAARSAPDADVLFLSCGGLHTAAITQPLEIETGLPMVSSAMAGTWGAVQLAGLAAQATGYGRLFENYSGRLLT